MILLTPRRLQTLNKVLPRVDPYGYVLAAIVLQGREAAADLPFHVLTNAGTAADPTLYFLQEKAAHSRTQSVHKRWRGSVI
jgi:hypothetical protein